MSKDSEFCQANRRGKRNTLNLIQKQPNWTTMRRHEHLDYQKYKFLSIFLTPNVRGQSVPDTQNYNPLRLLKTLHQWPNAWLACKSQIFLSGICVVSRNDNYIGPYGLCSFIKTPKHPGPWWKPQIQALVAAIYLKHKILTKFNQHYSPNIISIGKCLFNSKGTLSEHECIYFIANKCFWLN